MRLRAIYVLAAVVAVSLGCTRREETCVGDASTTAAEIVRSPALPPGTAALVPPSAPAAPMVDERAAARTEDASLEGPVPSWVPDAGRLTIVQAPDLARNLGLVAAPDAAAPNAAAPNIEAPR